MTITFQSAVLMSTNLISTIIEETAVSLDVIGESWEELSERNRSVAYDKADQARLRMGLKPLIRKL